MRKMKKINGYLVVKFNARELREYEGTALGEYGVIDAELYTGILDVDRGAMEYDNAGSMEEAVELARGLESELDAEEPEVKVTIVKETDETTEEEEVDAQQMIAGWENVLRGQVASAHYKDVDERTAAHELYGYKVALRDLGLLDREDCYVLPDTFGEAPGPLPKKPEELLAYVCDELCRHRRPEMTQEELDAVCEKCSLERLANEADGRDLRAREKALGALYGLIDRIRDRESSAEADRVGTEARAYNNVFEEVFTGYVSKPYNGGGFTDEVTLKDEMLLLEETQINNTFLDTTPQEMIAYFLGKAGLSKMKLSSEGYPERKRLPIRQMNVIEAINAVHAAWNIKQPFFFSGGVFYWGEKPEQDKTYIFEYGINIIALTRSGGSWELETVSAPFVRHSHKISVKHPKVNGEFEVSKVVSSTSENGFIRTKIYF